MARKTVIAPKPLGEVRGPGGEILKVWEEDRELSPEEIAALDKIAKEIDREAIPVIGRKPRA